MALRYCEHLMAQPSDLSPFAGFDIASLVAERAAQRGDHPCVIFEPFEGARTVISYAAFANRVARLAGGLTRRGIGPGDHVIVHLENCPETLIARCALAWLGAVCVGTNALAAGPELAHYADVTAARAAITQPKLAAVLAAHARGLDWIAVTDTDGGAAPQPGTASPVGQRYTALYGEPAPRRSPDPHAPASIMFTTGTTSAAKAVLWTHQNVLWAARQGAFQQLLRSDDVALLFLPVFHVVGLTWSFFPMFWAGGTAVLQPRYSASKFWPVSVRNKATVASHVPFTALALTEQEQPATHHYRQWLYAHMSSALKQRHRLDSIVSGYGMTELVCPAISGEPWSIQPERSVGRPSQGYRARIVDDDGRTVAVGDTGNLEIHAVPGLSMFKEYLGNAEATAAAFTKDGYFRTGDRAVLQPGGWIEYVERAKDVIKVGGENVSGAEVEAVLQQTRGIADAAAVAKPDRLRGEVVVAFITLVPGADEAAVPADALDRCRAGLAKFKVPQEIVVLPEMPMIGNGKIAKAKLRERFK